MGEEKLKRGPKSGATNGKERANVPNRESSDETSIG